MLSEKLYSTHLEKYVEILSYCLDEFPPSLFPHDDIEVILFRIKCDYKHCINQANSVSKEWIIHFYKKVRQPRQKREVSYIWVALNNGRDLKRSVMLLAKSKVLWTWMEILMLKCLFEDIPVFSVTWLSYDEKSWFCFPNVKLIPVFWSHMLSYSEQLVAGSSQGCR